MSKPATQIRDVLVLAKSRQCGLTYVVALASAQAADEFASGPAMEIALARSQDGQSPAAPEWVQLLPAPDASHQVVARDGRKWTLRDPGVVLEHFRQHGADLPIDLEHASELKAPKGEPAPAQAWIKEIEVRADRTVWGRPDWNADGQAAVLARHYRYLSPAMLYDAAGNITGLSSAALVTRPALRMPALAGDGRGKSTHPPEGSMTQIALATLIGVAGLASSATEAEVMSVLTANATAARDLKDPTKFVPAADLAAAQTALAAAQTELANQAQAAKDAVALASVETAIKDGKIPPASKDHWVSVAQASPEGFAAAIASMPTLAGKVTPTDKKVEGDPTANEHGLTPSQVALCAQMGVDQKAFAATLAEAK
ncbi:MAG: phage protease [Pseudomonadota bacterium]